MEIAAEMGALRKEIGRLSGIVNKNIISTPEVTGLITENANNPENCTVDGMEGKGEPSILVKIAGETHLALLDSGSSLSLLGDHFIQLIRARGWTVQSYPQQVKLAAGKTTCTGKLCLKVKWAGGSRKQTFVLMPGLCKPIVLGRDFIGGSNISIHIKERGWTLGNSPQAIVPFDVNKVEIETEPETTCHAVCTEEPDVVTQLMKTVVCPDHMRAGLERVVEGYKSTFTKKPGLCTLVEHEINTDGETPSRCAQRPINEKKRAVLDECINKLLADDIIEPCSHRAGWSSATVIVDKKDGGKRLCIDYRLLNKKTKVQPYVMPRIDFTLSALGRAKIFTTLDLSQGYHQLRVRREDRHRTTFATHRGAFRYKRLPMGLIGSGYTFQKVINSVLNNGTTQCAYAMAFLDDIVVFSESWEQHVTHLEDVLRRLKSAGFTVNPSKVQLCTQTIKFLGHVIKPGTVAPNPDLVAAIKDLKTPRNTKDIQRVIGTAGFYRLYIKSFSTIALPLTRLLKKNMKWKWEKEQQDAFEMLKNQITADTCLALPDMSKEFTIQTDASFEGIGSCLMQEGDLGPRPIAFASRTLTPCEQNYTISELEALAVVWSVNHFLPYVEMSHFKIETDHNILKTMLTADWPKGRIRRWALRLMGLDCEIKYRKGSANVVADMLSRAPLTFQPSISRPRKVDDIFPIEEVGEETTKRGRFGFLTFEDSKIDSKEITHTEEQVLLTSEDEQLDLNDRATWVEHQKGDKALQKLKEDIEAGTNKNSSYVIAEDGLISRHLPGAATTSEHRTMVPTSLRGEVLRLFHDHALAAHMGYYKTLGRIQERYSWTSMRQDVSKYVKGCDVCQKSKARNSKPIGNMASRMAPSKFTDISCDLMGPYPSSTTTRNQYIFVIVDDFTKNSELYPLRKATGKAVADCLIDYCTRYGFPSRVRSDNGPTFAGKLWTQMCAQLGMSTRKTVPYRPCGNPCERTNRDIKQCLVTLTQAHKDWDRHLKAISFALRTAIHQTNGYSPAELTFGEQLRFPADLEAETNEQPDASSYATSLKNKIDAMTQIVRENKCDAHETQRRAYDKKHRPATFSVGQHVLRTTHPISNAAKGVCASLAPKRDGPWSISAKIGSNTYQLSDPITKRKVALCNADQLTPYTASQGYDLRQRS